MRNNILIIAALFAGLAVQAQNSTQEFTKSDLEPNKLKEDTFAIEFRGNGNIQSSMNNNEEIPVNTGVGVYLHKYLLKEDGDPRTLYKIEFEATVNIASTGDSITAEVDEFNSIKNRSQVGNEVLTVFNTGQGVNFELNGYFKELSAWLVNGFYLSYTGANKTIYSLDTNFSSTGINTSLNRFRTGVFHDFVPKKSRANYGVKLGLGVVYNSISGDLGHSSNDIFRTSLFQSNQKAFYGYEFSLNMRLKNIKASFNYVSFPGADDISGLTGGQLITTISFVGGFGLKLDN